jgi:tetratricopeptide (TPR) repeat protein
MLAFRHLAFASAAFASVFAGAALAQATPAAPAKPKACEIDEGKPSDVAKAYLAIQQVVGNTSPKPGEVAKLLSGAVKGLSNGTDAPVGRSYELGKALTLWTMQPDVPLVTKRGPLGYDKNPETTIDLAVTIDSLFTIVEKAQPECKTGPTGTMLWRAQKAWIALINGAITELGAESLDSAETHARRSLILNHDSPYAYMVLGNVAARRNKTDDAIRYFQQTVSMAGSDTTASMAEVKRNTLNNLATTSATAADDAQDPATKARYYGIAKSAYDTLVAIAPSGSPYADAARAGIVRIELASGDTAAVKAGYAAMIANPANFSFNQLLQGGVTASNTGDNDGAIKLFGAAYAASPYHRDALKNLAIMYAKAKMFDKVIPLYQRLLEVDPNGETNAQLGVFAYGGLGGHFADLNKDIVARYNASKDVKLKKVLADSNTVTLDSNKYYVGLAVDLLAKQDSLPAKVRITEFSNLNDKVTFSGSIVNATTVEKTYVMAVDFLDKTGKVVVSQQANVGPVAPGGSGKFSITTTTPGIAAFKYARLQ